MPEIFDLPFKPALLIIDLQEDFLPPSGSLAVPGGRDVIPVINELSALPWHAVIASKDWHPKNHCSFATNHVDAAPFTRIPFESPARNGEVKDEMVWPVHCVQNSAGAEFPPEFKAAGRIDHTVLKGYLSDREYYSAFQDVWCMHQTELNKVLRDRDITDVYVVGLAFDYCVYNTAVDSAANGYTTHIIREGTMPVDPTAWDPITVKLQSKSVEVIDMNDELIERIKSCSSRRSSLSDSSMRSRGSHMS